MDENKNLVLGVLGEIPSIELKINTCDNFMLMTELQRRGLEDRMGQ